MSESVELNEIMKWPAYGLEKPLKDQLFLSALHTLGLHHEHQCSAYYKIISKLWPKKSENTLNDLPYLPVRLFKLEKLLSVKDTEVIKTMTSSGTSGQNVSQIFLDKQTSAMQVKALSKIVSDYIGPERLPMLVIDSRSIISDRLKFSARTAGILGFSMFGRKIEFALNDDMSVNAAGIKEFIKKYSNEPFLIFGFTFIVWDYLLKYLEINKEYFDFHKGILIHGGGWKKLESEAVDSNEFKRRLNITTGINKVHNYYGMVEQTGSIFMECEFGHFHSSAWSDIIVRDPINFRALPFGSPGLLQLLSVIPRSYPGHSLLSEDEGVLLGSDDCRCGRKGSYFKVFGRLQNAEMRGCSDTYTQ